MKVDGYICDRCDSYWPGDEADEWAHTSNKDLCPSCTIPNLLNDIRNWRWRQSAEARAEKELLEAMANPPRPYEELTDAEKRVVDQMLVNVVKSLEERANG